MTKHIRGVVRTPTNYINSTEMDGKYRSVRIQNRQLNEWTSGKLNAPMRVKSRTTGKWVIRYAAASSNITGIAKDVVGLDDRAVRLLGYQPNKLDLIPRYDLQIRLARWYEIEFFNAFRHPDSTIRSGTRLRYLGFVLTTATAAVMGMFGL